MSEIVIAEDTGDYWTLGREHRHRATHGSSTRQRLSNWRNARTFGRRNNYLFAV